MKKNVLVFWLAVFVAFGACSKSENSSDATANSQEEKQQLGPGERAIERWQALIEGNWDAAYMFETPGYRQAYTVHNMRDLYGGAVVWKSIKLLDVQQDDEKGTADVNLELSSLYMDAGGGEMIIPSVMTERWLLKDGNWWYVRK